MKTLLVTGASGFLGWNVSRLHPTDWRIVGTFHKNKEGLYPKLEHLQVDLTESNQTWRALKEIKPDAVFHLAANSDTNLCETEPALAHAINVDATVSLAEMCASQKIRFVFCSSEQVYDGLKEEYTETDEPLPGNEYGKQKLEAEKIVSQLYPESAIARIAVLFGHASPSSHCFMQKWLDTWQKFFPVTVFHDEIRNFLSAGSATEALFLLLQQDAMGVFNIGGASSLSRYDFALQTKESFNLDLAPIESLSQKDVKMAAYRPPRLVLDTSKIRSIGFKPRHVKDELTQIAKELALPPPFSEN